METLEDPKMPKAVSAHGTAVIALTDALCLEHLDVEYAQLCRKAVGKLARKRPSPLLRGGLQIWASGVVYAVGSANFLFDRSQPIHLSADELGELMGVKKTTMANKGRAITTLLNLSYFDFEFSRRGLLETSPMACTLLIDGLPVDVRQLPVEIQRMAFAKGLIPYVPAEKAD